MATNGSKWRILVGGVTSTDKISCETSASADITQDTIEVTCKDSIWKKYIGGERSWSMPFEAIKDETVGNTQADIIDNIVGAGVGGELDVALVELNDLEAILQGYSGKAILSSLNISGPKNDSAKISGTLQGTGALTKMAIV